MGWGIRQPWTGNCSILFQLPCFLSPLKDRCLLIGQLNQVLPNGLSVLLAVGILAPASMEEGVAFAASGFPIRSHPAHSSSLGLVHLGLFQFFHKNLNPMLCRWASKCSVYREIQYRCSVILG